VLFCALVHGLTRNGRDFDELAQHLSAAGRRVVCPDVVGRGRSEWLHTKALYQFPTYAAAMGSLHAAVCAPRQQVDWVGTSMGGIIGMVLGSMPGSPIRRLVLNDIGPLVHKEGLERLGEYCGKEERFESLAAVVAYLRRIYKPFGDLTDAQWQHLATHTCRAENSPAACGAGGDAGESATASDGESDGGGGGFVMRYDPGIAESFRSVVTDVDLWSVWEKVRCPVLVIRGETSDILTRETLDQMRARRPTDAGAFLVYEVPGVGHAPSLMAAEHLQVIERFLNRDVDA
jgi:pimeloyl-ACP methyl ester carboxylesterase